MRTIDCRDMPVPKPVVLAKSTLDELPDDSIVTIIVNCDMSEDNILAYAQNKGYFVKSELKNAGVFITIAKSNSCNIAKFQNENKQIESRAIIVSSDCIGRGIYGDTLMQEFLDSILVQKILPSKLIFINKGAKLTCADLQSTTLKTLKKIEDKGVNIFVNLSSLEELELQKSHKIAVRFSLFDLCWCCHFLRS